MIRRQFLLCSPAALIGSALPIFASHAEDDESTLGHDEQDALMNNAGDHYQQLFFTGVPWRTADEATERLEDHANHLVPW